MQDKCKCQSRAVELHKSTSEKDPIEYIALCRAQGSPVVIQPTTGDPLCPQGPYARHDTHVLLRNGQCPIPHRLFFFILFFALSLSLISPRAFSHGASFRLVLSPRGDPVSDALDASGS